MEETMIRILEEKTGRKFSEWIKIVQKREAEKHSALIRFLRDDYGLTHGYANLIVHRAKNTDTSGMQPSGGDLLRQQFKGKEALLPFYEKILSKVKDFGSDVEVAPKKTYVSLRRAKQFALLQPSTRTRLDVGLNLKGTQPSGKLESSASFSAMCTHRIRVESEAAIDSDLIRWLRNAYDQAS